jgi:hypothetical protein
MLWSRFHGPNSGIFNVAVACLLFSKLTAHVFVVSVHEWASPSRPLCVIILSRSSGTPPGTQDPARLGTCTSAQRHRDSHTPGYCVVFRGYSTVQLACRTGQMETRCIESALVEAHIGRHDGTVQQVLSKAPRRLLVKKLAPVFLSSVCHYSAVLMRSTDKFWM